MRMDSLSAMRIPSLVTLWPWVVPNIGRQLILERCIHGVAEQFQSRIRPEGNSALDNQPLLVVHDDLQALELVAIHRPHPAQERGALIELKLGCIGTGTTGSARLSENRRADLTPLDRSYWDRAVEYDVSASSSLIWAGVGLPDSRSLRKGCIVIPPMLCYLLPKIECWLVLAAIDSARA